MIKTINFH